jgi:hypothetical protein
MSVSTQHISRREAGARRRRRAPLVPKRPSPPVPPALGATASARRDSGPQDTAHYQCGCGCRFHASVSTSVGCPACGDAQAW